MKYEIAISGGFETRVVVNDTYEQALEAADKIREELTKALTQNGLENVEIRCMVEEASELAD